MENHCQQLYNCTSSSKDIAMFRNYVQSMSCDKLNIDLQSVVCAMLKQKTGKASGSDPVKPLCMAGRSLQCTYVFCSNLFLCHSFLPADYMACAISPVVKCKAGDLSDINNY